MTSTDLRETLITRVVVHQRTNMPEASCNRSCSYWALDPKSERKKMTIFGIGIFVHQQSFTSIRQYVWIWPLWPWIDLHNLVHGNMSPPTKFDFHRIIWDRLLLVTFQNIQITWQLFLELKLRPKTNHVTPVIICAAALWRPISPSQVSCPYNNGKPYLPLSDPWWPYLTFRIVSMQRWLHPPSFMYIQQL